MASATSPAELSQALGELLAPDQRLIVVYLFGSSARGTAGAMSDIDLAILFRDPIPPSIGGPVAEVRDLVERTLRRTCDVIDLRRAPADLVHRVLRDGILVLDRDTSARCAFEVARRNEYYDLLPILREYRRYPSHG